MPIIDGLQFLRMLREREAGSRRTPAIALTAYTRGVDRTRALLKDSPASGEGGLYALVSRWLFAAGSAVLWGDGRGDDATWEDFKRFDATFPLLITGVPAALLRVAKTRQRLTDRFGTLHADASALLLSRQEHFRDRGSRHDHHALMLAILWAATTTKKSFPTLSASTTIVSWPRADRRSFAKMDAA